MSDSTTKTPGTKAVKTTVMDDAPLFAGLDDFVLIQAEKKKAERPKKAAPPKEKTPAAQTQPAAAKPPPPKQPKQRKPRQSDPNSLLLSVAEMCALLRISRATLIRMDNAGKIPGKIKLGGSVRFHRETVEAWLKSQITSLTP
jgi:excisionase family DNA binding protein